MATQSNGIRALSAAALVGFALGTLTAVGQAAQRRKHASLTEQHRLHFELLCKAMDDPALAAVLDTYDDPVPPETQRQYLFVNALYTNALYFHRIGAMSRPELYGHLRVICQNQIVRDYLKATRHHRASLDDSSDEAALGQIVDQLMMDLEDADTEDWWVVGEPPVG
ncbi:DUF6082 family protein [Streptomyces sp. NPDC046821]|uniref:DUF6082 family protein n=1 Tax=Streptomyces sp. NPDC046821 TaxID=3154702 RepID=UPI0034064CEC